MNYPSAVFCFLYQGRLDEGQPVSGSPMTGNIVLSLCFAMIAFGVFTLLVWLPDFGGKLEGGLEGIFGKSNGKIAGQVLMLLLIALIFLVVSRTYGTKSRYDQVISDYNKLSEIKKKEIVRKGKLFFFVSITTMIVPLILLLAKTGI